MERSHYIEKAYTLALISTALGGINSVVFKQLLGLREAIEIAFAEALFLTILFFFLGGARWPKPTERWSLFGGSLLNACGFLCFFFALSHLHPVDFSFLSRNQATLAVVLAVVFVGERPSKLDWLRISMALLGAMLLTFSEDFSSSWKGTAFGLGFCFFFAVRGLVIKKGSKLRPTQLLFWGSLLSLLIASLYAPFSQLSFPVWEICLSQDFIIICLSSLFSHALGIALYFRAIQMGLFSSVSAIRSLGPFFVMLYSYFLFDYTWNTWKIVGATLATLAIVGLFFPSRKKL